MNITKRLTALVLCLIMLVASIPVMAAQFGFVGTAKKDNVAIYTSNNTASAQIATIKKNTKIAIDAKAGAFYRVVLDPDAATASYGWVANTDVSVAGATTKSKDQVVTIKTAAASGAAGYIGNCNSYVNWRATASSSGKKLGTLKKNQALTILGTEGKFTKVSVDGKVGYVSSEYVATSSGSGATGAPGTTSGNKVAYGDMRVTGDPSYSKLKSSVKKLLEKAQKSNKNVIGYVYSPDGKISQPIVYGKNLKYLDKNVSSFYDVQTRNVVVTAHNNRKASSSNFMFHWMHHYQEATLGYSKCMGSCKSPSISSSMSLSSSSKRLWDIAMFGYSQWELWAMYETQENEPTSTVNYNTQHLSNASASTIQQWINYQMSRANAAGSMGKVFNTNVKTNDVFLTMYTCGDEYDSSTAQSRLYFFFRAVK